MVDWRISWFDVWGHTVDLQTSASQIPGFGKSWWERKILGNHAVEHRLWKLSFSIQVWGLNYFRPYCTIPGASLSDFTVQCEAQISKCIQMLILSPDWKHSSRCRRCIPKSMMNTRGHCHQWQCRNKFLPSQSVWETLWSIKPLQTESHLHRWWLIFGVLSKRLQDL